MVMKKIGLRGFGSKHSQYIYKRQIIRKTLIPRLTNITSENWLEFENNFGKIRLINCFCFSIR